MRPRARTSRQWSDLTLTRVGTAMARIGSCRGLMHVFRPHRHSGPPLRPSLITDPCAEPMMLEHLRRSVPAGRPSIRAVHEHPNSYPEDTGHGISSANCKTSSTAAASSWRCCSDPGGDPRGQHRRALHGRGGGPSYSDEDGIQVASSPPTQGPRCHSSEEHERELMAAGRDAMLEASFRRPLKSFASESRVGSRGSGIVGEADPATTGRQKAAIELRKCSVDECRTAPGMP